MVLKTIRGTVTIWILLLSGLVFPFCIRSEENLDFLEKVENLQISPDRGLNSSQDSQVKSATKKDEVLSPKPGTKDSIKSSKTASKSKSSTPSKAVKSLPAGVSQPIPSQPIPTPLASPSPSPPPSPRKEPVLPLDSVANTRESEEKSMPVSSAPGGQIWIDEALEMEPDYLPGFRGATLVTQESEEPKEPRKPPTQIPKPQALPKWEEARLSIWNSFLDFLSQYQKAFYIVGVLVLFAIYRLKVARNQSSRKSVLTIRKLRR